MEMPKYDIHINPCKMEMSKYELCIHACKYAVSQLRKGSDGYIITDEAWENQQEIDWKEVIEWLNKQQEHVEEKRMTNRETLKDVIDDIRSEGGIPQEQLNTILLTSIANSLTIIADVLTDRKDNSDRCVSNGTAISKTDYENRLKADKISMLEEIQSEIEELEKPLCNYATRANVCVDKGKVEGIIQQKINALKEDRGNE